MAEQTHKVGGRIRELRESKGWSRPELARRLPGVATGNDVYRWELGKHVPRTDTLQAIAELFETTVSDLHEGPVSERAQTNGGTAASPLDGFRIEAAADQYEWLGTIATELSAAIEGLAAQINELRDGQTRLLADVSAVRTDLEDRPPSEVRPSRGREDSGR